MKLLLPLMFALSPCAEIHEPLVHVRAKPAWHQLLPDLVLGADLQGFHHARFAHRQALIQPGATTAEAHHNTHSMSRLSLGLRWTPRPRAPQKLPQDPPGWALLCGEWFELGSLRPTDLEEALDHWARREALGAQIRAHRGGLR